jgi:branched-chain amino acid transport system ATP-binding protein
VQSFCLSLDSDTVWGIIGPNGAGKTTVFNLVTGVYKPDNGVIRLNGKNIAGLPSHAIVSRGISRTFQNIRLFKSMTVLDNVLTAAYFRLAYPLASALARTKRFCLMERDLTAKAMTLLGEFGLADRYGDTAASLPYGMQRKLELARALVNGPAVLLLDEPGAGMNPSELDGLAYLILKMKREYGVAIVLIEHRMQLVTKLCDRVKVLNFGETIFEGRPADLADDATVVRAYFGEDDAPSVN